MGWTLHASVRPLLCVVASTALLGCGADETDTDTGTGAGGGGPSSSAALSSSMSSGPTSTTSSGGGGGGGACEPGTEEPCYSGPPGTEGVGLCKAGRKKCLPDGSAFGACVGEVLPGEETCETEGDDDCDGETNEGGAGCVCIPLATAPCYSADPVTEGVGLCKPGTKTCNAQGTGFGNCEGEITPVAETCASLEDEDCDGEVNEEGAGCLCQPMSVIPCYSGLDGTADVGACKSGKQTCLADGTDYGPCQDEVLPVAETCSTDVDDDCDGQVNEICVQPTSYKFDKAPECGGACYYDELHNIAINGPGQGANNNGFDQYAPGQLLDGVRGDDVWSADLGNGIAYEWVAWRYDDVELTFKFDVSRDLQAVVVGLSNRPDGGVAQPEEIRVSFSDDGINFSPPLSFKLSDGTMPSIPKGERQDVVLAFDAQTASYVKLFVVAGAVEWWFIDEVSFQ